MDNYLHARMVRTNLIYVARQEPLMNRTMPLPQDNLCLAQTLGGFLVWLNNPEHLADMNRDYFDFAMLGDDQKSPGANWVGSWHMRNLRIFAKLVRVADKPGDRVLVIYGAGHGFLLNEFAQQSHAFKVVSPEPLLVKAAKP